MATGDYSHGLLLNRCSKHHFFRYDSSIFFNLCYHYKSSVKNLFIRFFLFDSKGRNLIDESMNCKPSFKSALKRYVYFFISKVI